MRCAFLFAVLGACGGTAASIDLGDGGGEDAGLDVRLPDGGAPSDGSAPDAPTIPDARPDVGTEGCNGRPPYPPDAGLPTPGACGFSGSDAGFPLFDKCCTTTTDCVIATYQYRCCGDEYSFGINKGELAAFSATRAQWTCFACGCASGGNHTEDGLTAVFPTVSCDNGYCMTHGQK
jgi:hypothetical protein